MNMPYTIVFSTNNVQDVSGTNAKTALEALTTIDALQMRGEEIKCISSPQEGEIGVEMLRSWRKRNKKSCKRALEQQFLGCIGDGGRTQSYVIQMPSEAMTSEGISTVRARLSAHSSTSLV
jgi:hypothetical protein